MFSTDHIKTYNFSGDQVSLPGRPATAAGAGEVSRIWAAGSRGSPSFGRAVRRRGRPPSGPRRPEGRRSPWRRRTAPAGNARCCSVKQHVIWHIMRLKRKGVFSPLKVFPAPPKPAGQEAVSGMRECLELFGHNLCNEGERIKCDMEATYFPLPSIPPPARRTSDGPCNIHRLSFIACSRKHLFPLVRNPPSPIS